LWFCHGLKRVKDPNVGIGIEKFIEVVLSINQLKFEELKLVPGSFELLLSLLKQSLEFLDHSEILLPGGPIIKQGFQLIVLIFH
jgi:hypothetical protein